MILQSPAIETCVLHNLFGAWFLNQHHDHISYDFILAFNFSYKYECVVRLL